MGEEGRERRRDNPQLLHSRLNTKPQRKLRGKGCDQPSVTYTQPSEVVSQPLTTQLDSGAQGAQSL